MRDPPLDPTPAPNARTDLASIRMRWRNHRIRSALQIERRVSDSTLLSCDGTRPSKDEYLQRTIHVALDQESPSRNYHLRIGRGMVLHPELDSSGYARCRRVG